MSTQQVANRLVELCKSHQHMQALEELYADDIVSVEPFGDEKMPAETKSKSAVRGKAEWWFANFEIHDARVEGPLVGDTHFSVMFYMDVTNKMNGQRNRMSEIAVYEVTDGKIVREQFFYRMG